MIHHDNTGIGLSVFVTTAFLNMLFHRYDQSVFDVDYNNHYYTQRIRNCYSQFMQRKALSVTHLESYIITNA